MNEGDYVIYAVLVKIFAGIGALILTGFMIYGISKMKKKGKKRNAKNRKNKK